jgi:3-oxoadipate enol-lactonase
MAFARRDGTLLHYRLVGRPEAPALVFVNSLGTDARIWDEVIAQFPSHRCLSYDKRGHGLSDAPPGDYTLDQHLDDLEALLDLNGIEQAVLVGESIGGLISQGLALRAPRRLKVLVLCDTAPKMGSEQMWNDRIAAIQSGGMAAIADLVIERWFSPGFRQHRPDETAGWRNLMLRMDPHGYAATCATLRDTDLTDRIGEIKLPTLVVAGEDDLASPVPMVRACAEAIAGSRFVVLPGVGHIPSIEQPLVLAGLIKDFLEELGHV